MAGGGALARIAFIAIRAADDSRDGRQEAIVLGTNDAAGADWRYVCYDLSILQRILNDRDNPFDPKNQDYKANARYYDGGGTDTHLSHVSCDDDPDPAPPASAIELRGIVLCTAYRSRTDFTAPADADQQAKQQADAWAVFDEGPLARFDTIGIARTSANQPAPRWLVSRIVISPVAGKRGGLKKFSLRLQIRVALNGHWIRPTTATFGDRYDTRIHVAFELAQANPAQSLWKTVPNQRRGAVCDVIRITLTIGPWDSSNPPLSIVPYDYNNADLLDAVIDPNAPYGSTDEIDVIPFFVEQGIPNPPPPNAPPVSPERQFGLRLVGRNDAGDPIRVALRYELKLAAYSGKVAKILNLFFEDPSKLPTDGWVRFSQEQRVGDIGAAGLQPFGPVNWIVAVRVDAPSGDQITSYVVDTIGVSVRGEHSSLRQVRDGAPLSAIPVLEMKATTRSIPWHAIGLLQEGAAWRRVIVSATAQEKEAADAMRSTNFQSFEPRFIADMWNGSASTRYASACTAEFERMVGLDGDAPSCVGRISAPISASVSSVKATLCTATPAWQPAVSETNDLGIAPRINLGFTLTHTDGSEIVLGALGFSLQKDPDFTKLTEADLTGLISSFRYPTDGPDLMKAQLDALIKFPVERVKPVGQDELPPKVRYQLLGHASPVASDPDDPLIFELASDNSPPDPSTSIVQALVAKESVSRGQNQSVALSLHAAIATSGTSAYPPKLLALVIDPTPFRVAAVQYIEPARAATDQSNEVAVWSSEGDVSWKVLDPSEAVRVVLPPQVIGEAMEKFADTIAGAPKDVQPGQPAAARFGAHGRLEVDPTYADQFFREPGWNLRRIMGYPTMQPPGSRLKELRLELLYGMTTRISAPATRIDAFVTEIGGTLGAPVPPVTDTASGSKPVLGRHLALSRLVFAAQRRRLAADKIWSGRPDADLKIEDGVSFRLRTVDPQTKKGPATPLRWPLQSDVPTDTGGLIDSTDLKNTFSTNQDDRFSFPGGVAWAFESANILMKVYSRPGSGGGWAKNVYLSALGGYGGQRALFDEKKTIVETETGMGRVHRYKLERIGRIGGLWNRAKHVIIYERSVVPSAQFYNLDPIGLLQDEHAGRPVLRKVEEYVELLQPTRRYPEDGTSISAAGFLVGSDFKSIKIRVDSRWGGDVRREGWQVPLWNKAFAAPLATTAPPGAKPKPPANPDDPSLIYPKPQIRFILAGEGGSEISAEVDEPEKLIFYTSVVTGESGDDTDSWRPVRDVDFLDLPAPVAGRMKPKSENLTDAVLPSEPAHAPGFERMTIGLVRAKEAAVLTYGRSATGPGSIFKNLTIARAAPVSGVTTPGPLPSLGQTLSQGSADLRAAIDAKVGQALGKLEKLDPQKSLAEVKNDAKNAIAAAINAKDFAGDVRSAIQEVRSSLGSVNLAGLNPASPCASLTGRLTDVAHGQVNRLRAVADGAIDSALAGAMAPVRNVAGIARDTMLLLGGADPWLSPDERAALIDQLTGLQNRIAKLAEEVIGDIDALASRVTADLDGLKAVTGASLGVVQDKVIPAALSAMQAAFKDLKDAVGIATTVTVAIKASADDTLERLRAKASEIDDALGAIEDIAGFSATRRILPAIHDTLGQAIDVASALIVLNATITTDTKNKLATLEASLQKLEKALAARIGTAGTSLADLAQTLNNIVLEAQKSAGKLVGLIEDEIDKRIALSDSVFDRIAEAIIELSTPEDPDDDSYSAAAAVRDAMSRLADATSAIEAGVTKQAATVAAQLHTTLDGVAVQVNAAIDKVAGELKDACGQFDSFINSFFQNGAGKIADWLEHALDLDGTQQRLVKDINDAIGAVDGSIEDLKRRAAEVAADVTRQVENRARQIAGAVHETVRDALGTDPAQLADQANRIYQQGNDTLRLLRAVGDPPKTDRLGFNRPEVAYVLAETNKIVDMTPAIALVNRVSDTLAAADQAGKAVGDMLQSFGVRLPSSGVADQFIPDKLKQLSVADLIPNMGGIDFRGLLQRFAFPDLDDSKAIKIQHGFDAAQMRAWLQSDINVPFTEPAPLLSFGPVEIIIDTAKFNATARMSVGRDGTQKTFNGRIFGDWRVVICGQDILTFLQTGLYFDDSGKIDFKINPERVELADALQFLTDFLAAYSDDDGLIIEPLMRGGVPAGIAATLDIDLPDLELGVFGISDLSLHVMFGIAAIPEFELMCELGVATKTMPFTLSVWILNGGGFLTTRLSYLPIAKPHPVLTFSLEVGIVAGVGLGFNFGIVSGGVWLQVGCSITMTWSTGPGGNTTAISVFILARGNVDIAGLITAGISLLLEVTYDGSLMIGSGTLRLSFKISVFYTLKVCEHVEYVFAGQKKSSEGYSDSYA
ncbi:MAG: methyl-accepting chemotaxis protein [Pseudomonadota bacterium]